MRKLIPFAAYSYTVLVMIASLAKLVITFVPSKVPNSDKIGHFIAYFGFAIIWSLFFFVRNNGDSKKEFLRGVLKAAIFGIFFGLLMEVAQLVLTDYRQFDMKDALANTLGVLFAVLIMYYCANFFILIKKRAF